MQKTFIKYKYLILFMTVLIIVIISYNNYQSTRDVIESKYEKTKELAEDNILQVMTHLDTVYKIVEEQLNQEMQEYSQVMLDKYQNNPEVSEWDLDRLKEEFEDYEIYIIDENLQIIKTTYPADLGLDFSELPNFSEILQERLTGDSFYVDRIDFSIQEGKMKKYSYQPTPDNKYLLQLGIPISERYSPLDEMDLFNYADELTNEYKLVEDIYFFRIEPNQQAVGKIMYDEQPYLEPDITDFKSEAVKNAVQNNQKQVRNIQNEKVSYKFFPALLTDEVSGERAWASYVVGIKYDNSVVQNKLIHHRNLFLFNVLLMIAVLLFFLGVLIYLLRKFEYQAYHDQLTNLSNRELFAENFAELKKEAEQTNNQIAILFLDIDDFKAINDNFGHTTGDKVLTQIAKRLKNSLADNYEIARLGGDEFIIAINKISSKQEVLAVAENVLEEFKKPLTIEQSKLFISLSLGISLYPNHGKEFDVLLKKADDAMYKAKQNQNGYNLYENS